MLKTKSQKHQFSNDGDVDSVQQLEPDTKHKNPFLKPTISKDHTDYKNQDFEQDLGWGDLGGEKQKVTPKRKIWKNSIARLTLPCQIVPPRVLLRPVLKFPP